MRQQTPTNRETSALHSPSRGRRIRFDFRGISGTSEPNSFHQQGGGPTIPARKYEVNLLAKMGGRVGKRSVVRGKVALGWPWLFFRELCLIDVREIVFRLNHWCLSTLRLKRLQGGNVGALYRESKPMSCDVLWSRMLIS